ncbi:hypothetical protein ACPA9J_24430 [Pseudomonas aeruginosa]
MAVAHTAIMCDHLNGKLFVDFLSTLKRDRIRKKLEKQHRQQA